MGKAPRRHVRMFKPRFAEAVREGRKLQTVRPWPKRCGDVPQAGHIIDCRAWSGLPYRSKQLKLIEGEVVEFLGCEITTAGMMLKRYSLEKPGDFTAWMLRGEEREAFARADGFESLAEMVAWFESTHGLPFAGVLIKWVPVGK